MDSTLPGWLVNPTIWAAFFAWMIAQTIKMTFFFARTRKINFAYLVSTGGMPSAHSAMAAALATSVALRVGMADPLFAIALAFALVVMFDAQSVRRAAGLQARVLNKIVDELFKTRRVAEWHLAELLGHTPLEVFFGLLVGVFVAILVHSLTML
ncbi:MAG: divergent PAP2 family protein [Kiritimatiellia bacterium]|nr:divergent PAP2 family protein [Kiritimatiellia bacterium]